MINFPTFIQYTWALKWYSVHVITEEGVYGKDMVPESYGGPKLTVEVTQRILFATEQGYLLELRFDDMTGVMDSNGKTGLGATMEAYEPFPAETISPTGPSGESLKWEHREYGITPKLTNIITTVYATPSL